MNNLNSSIRFANDSDAYDIALIHVVSWQKIYAGHIPDSILDNLSVHEREVQWFNLLRKGVQILVIEHNNRIVGFASLCAARDIDMDPRQCGEISAIYIHPSLWHQGLGKKLCGAALVALKKMGFKVVILWVLKDNYQARKFYSALGFIDTGYTKMEPYTKDVVLNEICYQRNL